MAQTQTFRGVHTTTFMNDGELVGIYRGTPVASIKGNIIKLNTGGWKSNTTKTRMNQFSNNFCNGLFGVYQKDYCWFVRIGSGDNKQVIPFNDNVISFEI